MGQVHVLRIDILYTGIIVTDIFESLLSTKNINIQAHVHQNNI